MLSLLSEPIPGLFVVSSEERSDERGSFERLFCEDELDLVLGPRKIVQMNCSKTVAKGTVRGMHYQLPPNAEMKLVRCLSGRVWDVAVDLRANSPTFLHWYAEELSAENHRMMVIPEGFCHGFQVLDPHSELLYLHTESYRPGAERAVAYDDPRINIEWPLAISFLSERDRSHPPLEDTFSGIIL